MNGSDGSDSSHNNSKQVKKVFDIVQCDPKLRCGKEEDKDNGIASKFDQLNSAERYTEFQAQAYIIKQLKRKLRTGTKIPTEVARQMFAKAEEIIKQSDVELKDQQDLLKNLITAINQQKLKVGSLQFERICTIVRNSLEETKEAEFSFSKREQSEYGSLLKLDSMKDILSGKPVRKEITHKDVVDQYVLMQSDFFKMMTYQEFISTLKNKTG